MISSGEAPCAMATPNPMKNRAEMNIDRLRAIVCRTTPRTMMRQPIRIPILRPRISTVYGTNGMAQMEPIGMIALSIPRIEPCG